MLHQQTEETQGCHDDHIIIALFAVLIGQQEFRVILIYGDLKHTADIQDKGLKMKTALTPSHGLQQQHTASQ